LNWVKSFLKTNYLFAHYAIFAVEVLPFPFLRIGSISRFKFPVLFLRSFAAFCGHKFQWLFPSFAVPSRLCVKSFLAALPRCIPGGQKTF